MTILGTWASGDWLMVAWVYGLLAMAMSLTNKEVNAMSGPQDIRLFDAAPFGYAMDDNDGEIWGIRWGELRKVRCIIVGFADREFPSPDQVRLQYWHRTWDGRPDPVRSETGAGRTGWDQMDDWTNGEWKNADADLQVAGQTWTFTFNETGASEFKNLGHPGVRYRKTLKVRLVAEGDWARPQNVRVLTEAVLQPVTVRLNLGAWGGSAGTRQFESETGRLEVFNGHITAVRSAGSADLLRDDQGVWMLPLGSEGILEADVLMAVDSMNGLYDRTVLTVRSSQRPFSIAVDEVARGERLLIRDLDVLVTRGDDPVTLAEDREARKAFSGKTVYDRVFDEPEQTFFRAWNDMPIKRPLYFVHSLPGNRNAMHQNSDGSVRITSSQRWFNLPASDKDTRRKLWAGNSLLLDFGLPHSGFEAKRELKDGYLPVLRSWWQDGPLHYEQTTVLDKLDGHLEHIALDDPTVLLMRIRMVNTATDAGTASLLLKSIGGAEAADTLELDEDCVFAAHAGQPRLRMLFDAGNRGSISREGPHLRWTMTVQPAEVHNLYLLIPSITLIGKGEIGALRDRDFDADVRRVCDFWRGLTERGTQIRTAEPCIDDFYKAHLRHLMVNCVQEISSDRLHAHVGTFNYGVYPDESAMMISDLDRRGYHEEARRCLDAYLHYQGTVQMPGNFKSTEGLFYGAGGHESMGYNKSHGWVLWLMAEHWRNTRDRRWMAQAAPKLIAGCDWIIRERQATMKTAGDGTRPIEYGWLPAGSLEDVTDYWYWMVTNACTVWGFESLADALTDFDHPEAPRLQEQASAYRDDFMRAMTEARIRTPVVQLRDGTCVPKYPSRLYERGRCHGWLRETLEGAIHLPITGLIPPDAPETEWILKDFEDNLYISNQYGYAIPSFDRFWFTRGGFSMQANLLHGPLPYLYRDEIKHYLRAYFNAFASAFYPELRMCNEHSLPELGYPAGDHFKSSDEAQSTYWLRLMFVREAGLDLYLGQALPRYWLADGRQIGIYRSASYFGKLSFEIRSRVANHEIEAVVTPPERNRPERIYVRLRHPDARPIQKVILNGSPYEHFDVQKEWIILPGSVTGKQQLVAFY